MDFDALSKKCITNDIPKCVDVCPLKFDHRAFIKKMQEGAFEHAFKELEAGLMYPETISRICPAPCREVCFRKDMEGPVNLPALERACCREAGARKKKNFFAVDKKKTVLIIGAGISGITIAVRLARKGYSVTLVEKNETVGGRLLDIDEKTLPKEVLFEELQSKLDNKRITVITGHEVRDPAEFEHDAFFVTTGKNGDRFENGEPGRFVFGSAADGTLSIMQSMASVLNAANHLEAFFQKAARPLEAIEKESRYVPDVSRWNSAPPALTEKEKDYTKEEIMAEARRCPGCTCRECMESCDSLPRYHIDPLNAISGAVAALNKSEITPKEGQPFAVACTLCGRCGNRCPAGIDFGKIALYVRSTLQKRNDLPPAYHEFWLDDMFFTKTADVALVRAAKGTENNGYAFFPGCQLAGSDPEYVIRAYRYLMKILNGDVAMFARCCGIPAHWAGKEDIFAQELKELKAEHERLGSPKLIMACPSCIGLFGRFLPEIETVSLWEVLAGHTEDFKKRPGMKVSVFDPCISRERPGGQEAVRRILKDLGIENEELQHSGDDTQCCGYGGLIYIASENAYNATVKDAASLSDNDYVTYCSNCRDSFALKEKRAFHLLDLLFFDEEGRENRKQPGPSERRANRRALKEQMLAEFWEEKMEKEEKAYEFKITFSEEARAKMDKLLMLEEDAIEMMNDLLKEKKMIKKADGSFTAYRKKGALTYHMDFTEERGVYRIVNVYTHRTVILDEEN